MRAVRLWLPIVICTAGLAVIAIGRNETALEGGFALIGAGLSVWLLNWLHRLGVAGEDERASEDEAREFFSRHGHWPDEDPRGR